MVCSGCRLPEFAVWKRKFWLRKTLVLDRVKSVRVLLRLTSLRKH